MENINTETRDIVIVTSENQQIPDALQENLQNYEVARAEGFEEVNAIIKTVKDVAAIVIQVKNPKDLMCFEFCATAASGVPLFAVIDDETGEMQELVNKYGAAAIFSEKKTSALAAFIIAARKNLKPIQQDQNADFLRIFGDISRELGRLHDEFTETALRTLPQPFTARDTRNRLKENLTHLQAIKITP